MFLTYYFFQRVTFKKQNVENRKFTFLTLCYDNKRKSFLTYYAY